MNKNNPLQDDNPYISELKKCENKKIFVIDQNGNEFEGICKAINYMHLNVVLMTEPGPVTFLLLPDGTARRIIQTIDLRTIYPPVEISSTKQHKQHNRIRFKSIDMPGQKIIIRNVCYITRIRGKEIN